MRRRIKSTGTSGSCRCSMESIGIVLLLVGSSSFSTAERTAWPNDSEGCCEHLTSLAVGGQSKRRRPELQSLGLAGAMRRMLLVLFAVSGCAALIYQVVWFQLLSFAIGASALSLGVLLPTYLGGLCIGSLLLPRCVSRKAHPLRVLGALELAIGALGVAALYLIPALGGTYSAWAGTGAAGLALRMLVAALALLPATIL